MHRRTPTLVTAAVTAAMLACGTAAVALPASAATVTAGATPRVEAPTERTAPAVPLPTDGTTAPTPDGAPVDLTIVLRPDEDALRALPTAVAGASTAAREDAIEETAPAPSHGAVASAALVAAGFAVTEAGTWELDATGSAAQAEALFGVQLLGIGDGMHPTTAPVLPAAFGDAVVTVLGLDTRPVAAHAAVTGGTSVGDLAKLYSAPTASSAGAGATIATVQFSGWNRSDLATYAARIGRPLPALEQVSVDGASVRKYDGGGGETEVALDQETLLATAPAARQRIYVAPNSLLGMYDAYSEIADDVASHGITAVSISWGTCESLLGPSNRSVLENAIDRIVAAGATVFASSGDSGTACPTGPGTSVQSVSYPASSPAVVGVGGTEVYRSGSSYTESAWGNGYGASGGGVSVFSKPDWQTGTGISGTKRLVPDIAAVADPTSGPLIYINSGGGWVYGGGTSLAAPVLTGQFVASLVQRGCAVGVGDVHAALYGNPGAFRDVTTGSNFTDRARAGYDRATGLGTPNWSALTSALPVSSACAGQGAPAAVSGTRWTASTTPAPVESAIHSDNGQYWFELQTNGNLVSWGNGKLLWQSGSSASGATLRLVPGQTFAVVDSSGAVRWDSRAMVTEGATIRVGANGDVVLAAGAQQLWHTGTAKATSVASGAWLAAGHAVYDPTGKNKLVMRADGSLALTLHGKTAWVKRAGVGAVTTLKSNGDLVLRDQYGRASWHTGTRGSGTQLVVRTDGDLRLMLGKRVLWRSHTHV